MPPLAVTVLLGIAAVALVLRTLMTLQDWRFRRRYAGRNHERILPAGQIQDMTPAELKEVDKRGRPRPGFLRALGRQDPPRQISIDGATYTRSKIFKHDFWAATAVYQAGELSVVVKFNRQQPMLGIPLRWVGRCLARRERRFLQKLADLPNIPDWAGHVTVNGRAVRNAVAHDYIPGAPLCWHDRVDDQFFITLRTTLEAIHRRGVAYVDMNKAENIVLGADGNPYLIDFQISLALPNIWPFSAILKLFQKADLYHLDKHLVRHRPDLFGAENVERFLARRPWWIRAHRLVGVPLRRLRRRILVVLGVRRGKGMSSTEHFFEDAVKRSGSPDSSLLRLQATLVSDEYYQACEGSDEAYLNQLIQDLLHRQPRPIDVDRVQRLLKRESHDRLVTALLSSAEFFLRTGHLCESHITELHDEIRHRIDQGPNEETRLPKAG